jgi:hypothetical protein
MCMIAGCASDRNILVDFPFIPWMDQFNWWTRRVTDVSFFAKLPAGEVEKVPVLSAPLQTKLQKHMNQI